MGDDERTGVRADAASRPDDDTGRAERRALVVCTANLCRSPLTERLLQQAFDELAPGADRWSVRSAGTASTGAAMDPSTGVVAATAGIDLSDHRPRLLDRTLIDHEGADLVIAMTREHLRHVVSMQPSAWPRTFTLKELARRSSLLAFGPRDERFPDWRARLGEGRRPSDLMAPSPDDDIADPYGRPRRQHEAMHRDVGDAIAVILRNPIWTSEPLG